MLRIEEGTKSNSLVWALQLTCLSHRTADINTGIARSEQNSHPVSHIHGQSPVGGGYWEVERGGEDGS